MTKHVINLSQEKYMDTDFVSKMTYELYHDYIATGNRQTYFQFLEMGLQLIKNTINTAHKIDKIYLDIGLITWVIGQIKNLTVEEFLNVFVEGVYSWEDKLYFTRSSREVEEYVKGFVGNTTLDSYIGDDFELEDLEFISINPLIEDAYYKLSTLKKLINSKVLKREDDDLKDLHKYIFNMLGYTSEKDLEAEFAYGENRKFEGDYE